MRGLLAAGTGPGVLRGELRARTAGVRRLTEAARGVAGVGAALPPELFGTHLTELLSERLQGLLEERGQAAAPPVARRSAQAPGAVARAAHRGDFGALSRRAAIAPRFDPLRSDGRPAEGTDAVSPAARADPIWDLPQSGGETAGWATASPQEIARDPFAVPPVKPARPARVDSEPLLSRKLREYWELRQAKATAGPLPAAAAPAGETRPAGDVAAGPRSTRSAMPPDEIARQMQAFVSGPLIERSPARPARSFAAPLPAPGAGYRVPERGAAHQADSDLAEKLADILREQAILHGIDVT